MTKFFISTVIIIFTVLLGTRGVYGQIAKDSIKVEIKDSLLFINGEYISPQSIVEYFQLHFGKPDRKRKSLRYKLNKYIYDDLGISIMTHPKSISIDFVFRRIIRIQPKTAFNGTVTINNHLISPAYSLTEIETCLFPCRFDNLFNRSLLGTFFSFEKGEEHPEKLYSIGYHFIENPNDRIKPYLLK